MATEVRRLGIADLDAFYEIRLRALEGAPSAFMTTHAEAKARGPGGYAQTLSLEGATSAIFGAFHAGRLVGVVGVHPGDARKTAHKAAIWGMFVDAGHRGAGAGASLLDAAIAHARDALGARAVYLAVEAENAGARRLYEAKGFRCWGREPRAMCDGGRFLDEDHMTLLL